MKNILILILVNMVFSMVAYSAPKGQDDNQCVGHCITGYLGLKNDLCSEVPAFMSEKGFICGEEINPHRVLIYDDYYLNTERARRNLNDLLASSGLDYDQESVDENTRIIICHTIEKSKRQSMSQGSSYGSSNTHRVGACILKSKLEVPLLETVESGLDSALNTIKMFFRL